jgi:hypothetical protein
MHMCNTATNCNHNSLFIPAYGLLSCRKMYASSSKSMHMCKTPMTCNHNSMFSPTYGYNIRSKHTGYIRMIVNSVVIYNEDVLTLIRSTQSTPNNLFKIVNTAICPPPPLATNREAARSKHYPCVQLTCANRSAGKHVHYNGQYQSSLYRRGDNKLAPYLVFSTKSIIRHKYCGPTWHLYCVATVYMIYYVYFSIVYGAPKYIGRIPVCKSILKNPAQYRRLSAVCHYIGIPNKCRKRSKNSILTPAETLCTQRINFAVKDPAFEVKFLPDFCVPLVYSYELNVSFSAVNLSVRIPFKKMSESGPKSDGGGSGKYKHSCRNSYVLAGFGVSEYKYSFHILKKFYTSLPSKCYCRYISLNASSYEVMFYSVILICNCSFRYGE